MLLLLGVGVVANVILAKTKGNGGGTLMINWGWGLAVFAGVLVSQKSGAHLNPAVTLGLAAQKLAKGMAVDWGMVGVYLIAQLIGAFIGAVLAWLAYKDHFDAEPDPATKLGCFSTGPAIRSYGWNLVTEIIGTFVLVLFILALGHWNGAVTAGQLGWLGALPVGLLVVGIGTSLGGPTGYAINPNRDLGPRIAHAFLPIPNKGSSDWAYAWVPVVGPIIGGALAGLLGGVLLPTVG